MISSYRNHKNATSALRQAEIGTFSQAEFDMVRRPVTKLADRKGPKESGFVFPPTFVFVGLESGQSQLHEYVFQIWAECLASEASHVFEEHGAGTESALGPEYFWKQVSAVTLPRMFPSQRERLAGGATCQQVDRALNLRVVKRLDVSLLDRKLRAHTYAPVGVVKQRLNRVAIDFE